MSNAQSSTQVPNTITKTLEAVKFLFRSVLLSAAVFGFVWVASQFLYSNILMKFEFFQDYNRGQRAMTDNPYVVRDMFVHYGKLTAIAVSGILFSVRVIRYKLKHATEENTQQQQSAERSEPKREKRATETVFSNNEAIANLLDLLSSKRGQMPELRRVLLTSLKEELKGLGVEFILDLIKSEGHKGEDLRNVLTESLTRELQVRNSKYATESSRQESVAEQVLDDKIIKVKVVNGRIERK